MLLFSEKVVTVRLFFIVDLMRAQNAPEKKINIPNFFAYNK